MRKLCLRLALVTVSLLMASFLGEIGLRLLHPISFRAPPFATDPWRQIIHRHSDVPGLRYELVPGVSTFERGLLHVINEQGMRDTQPRSRSTPGLVTVAALGDSFTYGFGVKSDLTYANQAERELNALAEDHVFEVLNMGVGGYGTADEALVFEHRMLALEPDAVVLGYVLNDPEIDPIQPLQAHFVDVAWWQHLHLGRLVARSIRAWQIERAGGDYLRALHLPGRYWDSVVSAFDRMAELALAENLPVLVIIFPEIPPVDWEGYPYADLHEQVAAAAREAGFDVLDLLESYRSVEPGSLRQSPIDGHPTALGHELVAEEITTWILENTLGRDHAEDNR